MFWHASMGHGCVAGQLLFEGDIIILLPMLQHTYCNKAVYPRATPETQATHIFLVQTAVTGCPSNR